MNCKLKPRRGPLCAAAVLCLAWPAHAVNLTTIFSQVGGQDWSAAIWKTNGMGTAVSPTNGNTFECVSNGVPFGNAVGNTRLRNPITNATAWITFPGDSLTLDAYTELRAKLITSPAQVAPILNFPGTIGNPGLVLNGGMLNAGDDNSVYTITGKVQVTSQSYICPGNNVGQAAATRAFNIAGQLTGAGNMVIFEGTTNLAQQISGASNGFTGQWIIKAGWLLGVANNSLGTNSITVDPNYLLPLSTNGLVSTQQIVNVAGPALLEVAYDLNSFGTLALTNGGRMRLHQNCAFAAVNIEAVALSNGAYTYTYLVSNFPSSFDPGGSGSLSVGPPGACHLLTVTGPASQTLYAGQSATLSVSTDPPGAGCLPAYQWQAGATGSGLFTNLTDAAQVSGSKTASLTFTSLTTGNSGDYLVVLTNLAGSVTSSVATLTVHPTPPPASNVLESAAMRVEMSANPFSFRVLEKSTGLVLLLQTSNTFTFGGSAYPVLYAVNTVCTAATLDADLVPSAGTNIAHVKFAFTQPEIIQTTLYGGPGATNVFQQFADQGEEMFGGFECPTGGTLSTRNFSHQLAASLGVANVVNFCSAKAPFYLTSRHYGIYAETDAFGTLTFAQNGASSLSFSVPQLTFDIIYGPAYADIMARFSALAGASFMPPTWTFDSIWWKDDDHANFHGSVTNAQGNVLDTAIQLANNRIHASAIWIDRPYGTGTQGWGNLDFDSSFPNPAQMVSDLAARGLNLMLWVSDRCWASNYLYTNGLTLGYLFPGISGSTGPAPDFRNTNAYLWYQSNLNYFINLGVKGYKIDRGDEGELPDWLNNKNNTFTEQLSYTGLNAVHTNDSFTFSRCASDTGRRFTALWNGDTYSTNIGLQYSIISGLRAGIIGFPMWGSDTGGYIGKPTEELFARWLEFSAWCPMMEALIGNSRTPWYDYSTNLVAIAQAQSAAHHDLIPYSRSHLYQATQTGMPLMRPIMFAYPADTNLSLTITNCEYIFGAQILVAPVFAVGATNRNVYLPAGYWLDYNSKSTLYTGPTNLTVPAPLTTIPLFVNEGAIVPRGDIVQGNNLWTSNWAPALRLEIFPSDNFGSAFPYYTGGSVQTITCTNQNHALTVQFGDLGVSGTAQIYLKNPGRVLRNGLPLTASADYTYNPTNNLLQVPFSGATLLIVSNATSLFAPIELWRQSWFGSLSADPTISGNSADPDHDNIPNLFEYAFGLDPLTLGSNGVPSTGIVTDGGINYLAVTFQRATNATDVTCTVMVAPDLIQWQAGSSYSGSNAVPVSPYTTQLSRIPSNGLEVITVRDNIPIRAAAQRFMRVRVTNP